MFIWDFNVIVAFSITFGLGVVLVLWVVYTLDKGGFQTTRSTSDREFFRQCSFCSYLYLDYFKKEHGQCPRCGSYQG